MGNFYSSCETKPSHEIDESDAAHTAEYATGGHASAPSDANSPNDDEPAVSAPHGKAPRSTAINQLVAASNPFKAALQAVANKVQILALRAYDAVANAVQKVKQLGFIGFAKEVGAWAKAHPAQAAAIIVTLVVMVSTPVVLASLGFTTAGIAAASTAAGIQSGIGSVVAGSAFAICQSAMMGGYGVFIFAALLALSGAVAWTGAAMWNRFKSSGSADKEHGEGTEDLTDADNELALLEPVVSSMSIAKDLAADSGQIIKLGAIFIAATAVYRYRRWQNARTEANT